MFRIECGGQGWKHLILYFYFHLYALLFTDFIHHILYSLLNKEMSEVIVAVFMLNINLLSLAYSGLLSSCKVIYFLL